MHYDLKQNNQRITSAMELGILLDIVKAQYPEASLAKLRKQLKTSGKASYKSLSIETQG